jgi:restriction system protein
VPAPTGLFGRKKKLAEAQAAVEARYAYEYEQWQRALAALPAQREKQATDYAAVEKAREDKLAKELVRYERESAVREREAQEQNSDLDELIAGLGYGTVEAVQEYVGIVLANSVYPESFPVAHAAEFEPSTAELRLHVVIPGPDHVPTIKAYKFTKSTDEITSTSLSQKDIKDRYAGIVHSVALRSLHEVFEADRRSLVREVSLELGTNTINPATGRETYVPFVAVAVERESFGQIDLSAVVPAATLEHLGAAVSKNPHALVPASGSGVRRV